MKMNNNCFEVFLDYDSMLNDLAYSWIRWSNLTFGTSYTVQDVDNWYWYNNVLPRECFNFFQIAYDLDNKHRVRPLEGSVEFFKHVSDNFVTKILTSTYHDEEFRRMKNEHIEHHYGTTDVIHEHDKFKHAHQKAILVDDRDLNILQWTLRGGIGILFNHNNEYNHNENKLIKHPNIYHASNYEEVKEIFASLTRGS